MFGRRVKKRRRLYETESGTNDFVITCDITEDFPSPDWELQDLGGCDSGGPKEAPPVDAK